jgi:hypothetical protein
MNRTRAAAAPPSVIGGPDERRRGREIALPDPIYRNDFRLGIERYEGVCLVLPDRGEHEAAVLRSAGSSGHRQLGSCRLDGKRDQLSEARRYA